MLSGPPEFSSSCFSQDKTTVNMISFLIHYRGDKVRKFNEWQDDPYKYLNAFVNDDLQTLGLPPPHTCACTWRSGVMKCMWRFEEGSVRDTISCAFDVQVYDTVSTGA